MLNFVIYNSNKGAKFYNFLILNIFGCRTEKFKIHDYGDTNNTNLKNKIYILSSDNIELIVKLAKSIRNENDWYSPIIVISSKIDTKILNKCKKLLIFDFLDMNGNFNDNFKSAISKACYIITADTTIDFMKHGEIYKIPYKDVLFIEKENNSNCSIIYTKSDVFKVNCTIKSIEERLDSPSFFKSHRSCIVNLDNVTKYKYAKNDLYFEDLKTNLISREKKQILKDRLLANKIVD